MGRIAVLVINDLVTDNRVAKTCDELRADGHEVTLFGRLLPRSLPIERPYFVRRFRLLVNRGPLFYLIYNLRLFFALVALKPEGIYVNDVDTGLAALMYRFLSRRTRNANFSGEEGRAGLAAHAAHAAHAGEGASGDRTVTATTAGPSAAARKAGTAPAAASASTSAAASTAHSARTAAEADKAWKVQRKIPIIYDAHELFTEVPELSGRPAVRRIWSWLERRLVRASVARITVSNTIAVELEQRYNASFQVVRNIPPPIKDEVILPLPPELGQAPFAILQGAGINVDRGGEELVLAMKHVEEVKLLVVGDGDALPAMKQLVEINGLADKVVFLPRMPKADLMGFTRRAVLGLAIDKVTNLNYRYALPNKLFDFIQAGVPVIHADGEEIGAVVSEWGIGLQIESHQPEHIARAITDAWSQKDRYARWKENLERAAESLTWSREKTVLQKAIRHAF